MTECFTRNIFNIYSCRCAAIGECKIRGGYFKHLLNGYQACFRDEPDSDGFLRFDFSRSFYIPEKWAGKHICLNLELNDKCAGTVLLSLSLMGEPVFDSPGNLSCGKVFETDISAYTEKYISSKIPVDISFSVKIKTPADPENIKKYLPDAYLTARNFVSVADFSFNESTDVTKLSVKMNSRLPADVTLELYDDELSVIHTQTKEIASEGTFSFSRDIKYRLALVLCKDEVILVKNNDKRPPLPKGSGGDMPLSDDLIICEIWNQTDPKIIRYLPPDIYPEIMDYDNEKLAKLFGIEIPTLSFFEYYLNIYDGERNFVEQKLLPVKQTCPEKSQSSDMADFTYVKESEEDETISFASLDTSYVFSKKLGCILKCNYEGKELFDGGIRLVKAENGQYVLPDSVSVSVMEKTKKYTACVCVYLFGGEAVSAFFVFFADGQVSVSFSGDCDRFSFMIPYDNTLDKLVLYGGKAKTDIYRSVSPYRQPLDIKNTRWLYIDYYSEKALSGAGCLIKSADCFDVTSGRKDGVFCVNGQGESFSFVVEPILCDDEDVVRSARTFPTVVSE